MTNLIRFALGLLLALIWSGSAAAASESSSTADYARTFTYDAPTFDQLTDYTAYKRGSPAKQDEFDVLAGQRTVDRRSDGTVMRPGVSRTPATYADDLPASLAHIDSSAGTTGRPAQGTDVGFSSRSGSHVAANTGAASARNVLIAQPRQLQAKFGHAADFGVTGNFNRANAAEFNGAIFEHINAPGTTAIRGTYRGDAVTHFLDPTTGLNVISRDGVFVSGWRLNPDQLANVLRNGSLGGG